MELAGQHVRPEPLEGRRKRLGKLLSRSNRVMRDGIQLSEAISGDGAAMFRHACGLGFEGIVSKHIGSRYVSGRTRAWLKTKNHPNPQATFFTSGTVHVPSMIEGGSSCGQYIRNISLNLPAGAGSQFASFSGPGD
jgi:ATP-dependent DNA ligase